MRIYGIDLATGEETDREMTEEELAQYEKDISDFDALPSAE
jgi:hypothetical protein